MPQSVLPDRNQFHIVVASLGGLHVYALGVDEADKPIASWQSPRQFWLNYFQMTGPNLDEFSILRDVSRAQQMSYRDSLL
jgi:hypothetical protein